MAEQFYTILTSVGKAKIANASALGTKVEFKYFALGDGNGSYYNPIETQTTLKNEVWRGQIGQVAVDEKNPNWIVLETVIPADQGGFMIREAGVFDVDGNLLAIGKYPETYKPAVEYGSAKDLYVRMILEVANTSVVNLKVDPTVILATKKDIDILTNRIAKNEIDISTLQKEVSEHKADIASQEVGKGADIIGLPDPNNLFTATNIGGAMQELFTNVSSGKSLVGGAITGVDDSVVIPTDPTFGDLASAIGSISTGKKWASGVTNISTVRKTFRFLDNLSNSDEYYAEVISLTFTPSLIILDNGSFLTVYRESWSSAYNSYNIIQMTILADISGSSRFYRGDISSAHVDENGFLLPIYGSGTCNWIAIE